MFEGQFNSDNWHRDATSIARRNAIRTRRWGMRVTVYQGGSAGDYVLSYNLASTNLQDNANWLKVADIGDTWGGGGGSVNIYNTDGILTANRFLDGNSHLLNFGGLSDFEVTTINSMAFAADDVNMNLAATPGQFQVSAGSSMQLESITGTDIISDDYVQILTGTFIELSSSLGDVLVNAFDGNFGGYASIDYNIDADGDIYIVTPTGNLDLSAATYSLNGSAPSSPTTEFFRGDGTWAVPGGGGVSFGTVSQVPFMNATNDDFDYEAGFEYDSTNNRLTAVTLRLGNTSTAGSRTLDVESSDANSNLIVLTKGNSSTRFSTTSASTVGIVINPFSSIISNTAVSTLQIRGTQSTTGQNVEIIAGTGTAGSGGDTYIRAGSAAGGEASYGDIFLSSSIIEIGIVSHVTSDDVTLRATGGNSGDIDGLHLNISGGNAYTVSGNGNGGNVNITSGALRGTGLDGNITIDPLTGFLFLTLPTSSAGLPSGACYWNSNVLTQVP